MCLFLFCENIVIELFNIEEGMENRIDGSNKEFELILNIK